MVDYSRASTSKAAKEAFDSTATSLIKAIEALKEEYNEEWVIGEGYRKGISSIIDKNVLPILKANDIKLEKPLSRCNHEELMAELGQVSDGEGLPYESREEIKVAMVRITGRYNQIQDQAKKLDALSEKLAQFYLPEKDHDQEVIISFDDLKKARTEKDKEPKETEENVVHEEILSRDSKKIDTDLEEVKSVTKANPELLDSFEGLVESELKNKEPNILEESDITVVLDTAEEEFSFDEAFDSLFDGGTENDDASLMEDFLENQDENMPDEVDFQTYELKPEQTLAQIVDYVYEGKLSWYDIYRYGNNQGMIDRKCAELNVDPEDAAYTEGVLSGINIEYPKNFVTYESIKRNEAQEERGFAKAA